MITGFVAALVFLECDVKNGAGDDWIVKMTLNEEQQSVLYEEHVEGRRPWVERRRAIFSMHELVIRTDSSTITVDRTNLEFVKMSDLSRNVVVTGVCRVVPAPERAF